MTVVLAASIGSTISIMIVVKSALVAFKPQALLSLRLLAKVGKLGGIAESLERLDSG